MAGVTLSGGMMGNGAMLCGIHQWFIRTDDYSTAQSFLEATMCVCGRMHRPCPKVQHPAFAESGGG